MSSGEMRRATSPDQRGASRSSVERADLRRRQLEADRVIEREGDRHRQADHVNLLAHDRVRAGADAAVAADR